MFLGGLVADLRDWAPVDTGRFVAALVFPCDRGHAPVTGRQCFDAATEFPDTAWLRGELRSGRVRRLGEVEFQFLGMSPTDPRTEQYWQLAEEFDFAVGIHLGAGPPGVAYESSPVRRSGDRSS